jgi:hypothetical protein
MYMPNNVKDTNIRGFFFTTGLKLLIGFFVGKHPFRVRMRDGGYRFDLEGICL